MGMWSLTSTPNLKHSPRAIAVPTADFCLFILLIVPDLRFNKELLFSLFFFSACSGALLLSRTYLGIGDCCCSKALMRFSVQSPTAQIWMEKKFSTGAEVRVKGCHSREEIEQQLTKIFCPTFMLKPCFFICNSKTLDRCMTTYKWAQRPKEVN